jgi:hypothetical protein
MDRGGRIDPADHLGRPWRVHALTAAEHLALHCAGFVPVYQEPEEQLSRIANRTVTAFLHVSLVDQHPRLAVYVRPNGWLGRGYLRLIEPFRRWVVYPALLEAGGRAAARLARR